MASDASDGKFSVPPLSEANKTNIMVTRKRKLTFKTATLKKLFSWNLVADISMTLLGSDFLEAHDLLVHCKHKRLLRLPELTSVNSVMPNFFQKLKV